MSFDAKLRKALGRRIRQRRAELKLSQRQFVKVAGLGTQVQLCHIERGNRGGLSIESARQLAKGLGWTLSRLFNGF